MGCKIKKIISGGQTGVDQGALEAAFQLKILSGGYCPKGRKCEDGLIPEKYPLKETVTSDYQERTEMNVIHSDGTLILFMGYELEGGTLYTKKLAEKYKKPFLILHMDEKHGKKFFNEWISENNISALNVAGPRESKCRGIYEKTVNFLTELLTD